MNIRQQLEDIEKQTLSKYATLSSRTLGRERKEVECDIRPAYQRDRDRILHSKAFRRLKHKTQVFLAPEGDHYRTRLTHTLEVAQISRTITKALRLNEDLAEAIALGHDLGHTPFGHAGEDVLNKICPFEFLHNEQSVRIVEKLENNGKGLNLTKEVKDGILNHGTSSMPFTMEGKVVRLADKIAYINHDIDDSIRAKIFEEKDLPKEFNDILGDTVRKRLDTLIRDIIIQSKDKDDIIMSDEIYSAMMGLRKWMFTHVYTNDIAKKEEKKVKTMLENLYCYYINNSFMLPNEYLRHKEIYEESIERVVCDYIAGMTDQYAIYKFKQIFIPKSWDI